MDGEVQGCVNRVALEECTPFLRNVKSAPFENEKCTGLSFPF